MAEKTFGSDLTPANEGARDAMSKLMHQEYFTPLDLARLLDEPVSVITHAAFSGHLKADIVNHNIVGIKREDALAWMASRD